MSDQKEYVDTKVYRHIVDAGDAFEVKRYLEDPYVPKGPCTTCGKTKYTYHYNATIHPDSYVKFAPDDPCVCPSEWEIQVKKDLAEGRRW